MTDLSARLYHMTHPCGECFSIIAGQSLQVGGPLSAKLLVTFVCQSLWP